jgi:hypothetical protein
MSDKPIKHIELSLNEWTRIKDQLIQEHGMRILLSWVSKDTLGFTIREHRAYGGKKSIHLDFYDESCKTFFLLKYHNYG